MDGGSGQHVDLTGTEVLSTSSTLAASRNQRSQSRRRTLPELPASSAGCPFPSTLTGPVTECFPLHLVSS